MSDLTVVYLLYRFPTLSETFIVRELEELHKQGVQLKIVSLLDPKPGPKNSTADELLQRVRYLPAITKLRFWQAHFYFLATQPLMYVRLLAQLLAQPCRSIPLKLLAWRIYIFMRAISAAYLLRDEEFDLIHAHFAAWPGAAAWIISKLLQRPYTITAGHGYDIYTASTLVGLVTPDAKHVVTVAGYNRKVVLQMSPRLQKEDVSLLPCSIDVSRFPPPVERNSGETLRLISVGRYVEEKGHPYLVQACARLKQLGVSFRCTIIGSGTRQAEQSLQNLVQELGLTAEVHLAGAKTFSEIYAAYLEHDIFVMPCVVTATGGRDAAPVAMVEAAATGLPLISSPVGGVTDIVKDGINGVLVPEKDSEAVANAVILLGNDPKLRWRMGQQGRRVVEQNFDVQKNATALIRIFEEASGRNNDGA